MPVLDVERISVDIASTMFMQNLNEKQHEVEEYKMIKETRILAVFVCGHTYDCLQLGSGGTIK